MQTIPITIGITGHRKLRENDRAVLFDAVKKELRALKARVPHSELRMLNCLAAGADQLCAEAAVALGIPLFAVLPFERADYEADFSEPERERFSALLAKAERVVVAPEIEPAYEKDRDYRYRQAGAYVCMHSHVLLALWNGEEGTATGCGTADVVHMKLYDSYRPKEGLALSGMHAVIRIAAPKACEEGEAGGVSFLGDADGFCRTLSETDGFNALASASGGRAALLPEDRQDDPALSDMEAVYCEADRLSMRFAKRYRRILAWLAVCSTAVTAAFLLYDEAELHWMIAVCGGSLLLCFFLSRFARRSDCHRKYLDCRVLAEGIRVQAFLRYAGSETEVPLLMPWSQRSETPWICAALAALNAGPNANAGRSVREDWIKGQADYHQRAGRKAEAKKRRSERIVKAALIVSVCFYLAALLFEPLFGGTFSVRPAIGNAETYRTVLKLILGGISAATLFMSGCYGKLSLSRAADDHRKMADFYRRIDERIARFGQSEALLAETARIELVENGNWYSYQQDNSPDVSL